MRSMNFITKGLLLKNLPSPLFAKEGFIPSLWQREVRRDFIIDVFILITCRFFLIEMNYKICYISFSIQINECIEVEAVFSSQLMCLGTERKSLSLHRMAQR